MRTPKENEEKKEKVNNDQKSQDCQCQKLVIAMKYKGSEMIESAGDQKHK